MIIMFPSQKSKKTLLSLPGIRGHIIRKKKGENKRLIGNSHQLAALMKFLVCTVVISHISTKNNQIKS